MTDLLLREFVSLIKWVTIGYLLIRMAAYHFKFVEKELETVRTKNRAVLMKAVGIVLDEKLRKFVDFLIKEVEKSQR